MTTQPIADGLFTVGVDPQLIGSRCTDCGIVTFPAQDSCPRCAVSAMAEHLLARRGRLWAWTTQGFPPPTPPYLGAAGKDFVPFGVGYVELGDVKVEARLTESDPAVLDPGHDDGAGPDPVPHRRRRQRRRHLRVPPRDRGEAVSDDVAVIGVGMHPFGRFPGVSAIEMGAVAIRRALADAGVEWRQIQFAFAGSYEVDNPDAVVALMGLTGIPFTDVYNGCATAASALSLAAQTVRLGEHELGIAVGMDKHLPGRVQRRPPALRVPVLVRRGRAVHHHEVLRDEDQQVHARPRHLARRRSPTSPRKVTATARTTRTRSAARRSPRRRSSRRRC